MKKIYSFMVYFLGIASAFSQTTVNLIPDKDNSIFSHNSSASNGAGPIFIGKVNNGSSTHRGLLHFDLSGIPANAVVSSVSLTLVPGQTHGGTYNIGLHKLSASWGEAGSLTSNGSGAAAQTNDATWTSRFFNTSNNWTAAGGDFNATASATTSFTAGSSPALSFSSTSQLVADVQSWITTPSGNSGWLLKNVSELTNGNSAYFSSREDATAGSRPTLSITYTIVTPVTLKNFTGSIKGGDSKLQWQTASEQNSDNFEIQYSKSGENFVTVGSVKAAGNSSEIKSYSFIHPNIGSGKHYYRLAQHDLDGRFYYSSVVVLSSERQTSLQLSPNPADKMLKVTAERSLDQSTYNIISASGHIVRSGMLNNQQLDISNLQAGIYQLTIQTWDKEILRSQFIKK